MEFEQEKQPDGGIDAATRLAASARQINITPIHESVAPEDTSSHAEDYAMMPSSIPGESEVTVTKQTARSDADSAKKNHHLALGVSIGIMLAMSLVTFIGFTAGR